MKDTFGRTAGKYDGFTHSEADKNAAIGWSAKYSRLPFLKTQFRPVRTGGVW